jgi:glycosyltransferase involved in cell wall biosynthesis
MRLTYLTRVDISSTAAQARQIQSMARAFNSVLGNDFLLVCSGGDPPGSGIPHRSFPFSKIPKLRYLGVCLYAAAHALARRDQAIFTRDIMVAAVVTALGGRAVYEAHKDPKGIFSRYIMKGLARLQSFKLVTISGALGAYYQKHYGIPDSRLLVAHDGVFPEDYEELRKRPKSELRKELGLPLDKTLVVHTGSLYKGGAELFGSVVEGRKDLLFVHVGGGTDEVAKWISHYRDCQVESIIFLPHQPIESVRKYQVAADALFYVSTESNPIYWCTSPLKLFEYMASSTPIIGSYFGSVKEVLNISNAFCYDPVNTHDLRCVLAEFFNDKTRGKGRASRAIEEVYKKYAWSVRTRNILSFIVSKNSIPQ